MDIDFDALRTTFLYHLNSLKDFHFSPLNPVFWVFLLLLFLILLRFWEAKKTFSFCLIVAIALLATTKLENFIADTLMKSEAAETFYSWLVKLLSIIALSFVFLYYLFIRRD